MHAVRPLRSLATRSVAVGRRMASTKAASLRFARYGSVKQVIKMEDVEVKDPAADEVQVSWQAAPEVPLPAVAGHEGIGVASKVGSGVKGIKEGDTVVPVAPGAGTWSKTSLVAGKDLAAIEPVKGKDVGDVASISAAILPGVMARAMLDASGAGEGDVVVQTMGLGTVGMCVNAEAAARGIVVVNTHPDHPDWQELSAHVQGLNPAAMTLTEEVARSPEFARVTSDLPRAKAVIDGAGGAAALQAAYALGPGGQVITYSNASRKPLTLSYKQLLGLGISARGFSVAQWAAAAGSDAVQAAVGASRKAAGDLAMGTGALVPVRAEKMAGWEGALRKASDPYERQVVLVM